MVARGRPALVLGAAALVVLGLVLAAVLTASLAVRRSLPPLDGERAVASLATPVEVVRDAQGIPTIVAGDPASLAFGLGFCHGQDRFFQMDLSRRSSAGRLAALFGAAALPLDREARRLRFGALAESVVARATPLERAQLEAYARGVNEGLASLGARPPEYWVLRQRPEPWRPADCVLVFASMFRLLQDEHNRLELLRAAMHRELPDSLVAFLDAPGDAFDTPVRGGALPVVPPPGPASFDLRDRPAGPGLAPPVERPTVDGSNNFAVSAGLGAGGRALAACDMHLPLGLPNTWYRASLRASDRGAVLRGDGCTLPGVPALVVGSNGAVAWGLTNSYGDWHDWVLAPELEDEPGHYSGPAGNEPFVEHVEAIAVAGGEADTLRHRWTRWGPWYPADGQGPARALQWVPLREGGMNLALLRLLWARSVDEAVAVAQLSGIPAVNLVAADHGGRIGWAVAGRIPRRTGHDGRRPLPGHDPRAGWRGWLEGDELPGVVDPVEGWLATANNRVLDGVGQPPLGDGGYVHASRAWQIGRRLGQLTVVDEAALLGVALDDEALLLARWHQRLLPLLGDTDPATRERLAQWGGHASTGSVAYRVLREWRDAVVDALLAPFEAALEGPAPPLRHWLPRPEIVAWELLERRPAHLLDPRWASWDELLRAQLDSVLARPAREGVPLEQWTWGRRNTLELAHPLAAVLPGFLAARVSLPGRALPGDSRLPRVQNGRHGASQRLVVSPGREGDGLLHMPGGQSGHPLSPWFGDMQGAWERGEATPLLPGAPVHRLRLVPGGDDG